MQLCDKKLNPFTRSQLGRSVKTLGWNTSSLLPGGVCVTGARGPHAEVGLGPWSSRATAGISLFCRSRMRMNIFEK